MPAGRAADSVQQAGMQMGQLLGRSWTAVPSAPTSVTLITRPRARCTSMRALRFALEAIHPSGIHGKCRREDLDRHVAPQLGVGRAINLAHSAFAELGADAVMADEGRCHYLCSCSGANRHNVERSAIRSAMIRPSGNQAIEV